MPSAKHTDTSNTDLALSNRIAKCVLDAYRTQLAPAVPLLDSEWTIVAGVAVSLDPPGPELRCISLGMGLKCLGNQSLLDSRQLIADCHAEVLAGRGFRAWLARVVRETLERSLQGSNELERAPEINGMTIITIEFDETNSVCHVRLNPNLRFHLYSSESPCGDASMEALDKSQTEEQRQRNEKLRDEYRASKLGKSEGLGAGDEMEGETSVIRGRLDYSKLGVLRTKPGRPDSDQCELALLRKGQILNPSENGILLTLARLALTACSMSCSDKMARWNVVGLGGHFLSTVLQEPIYLSSVVVGGSFDEAALQRALFGRLDSIDGILVSPYRLNRPSISPCTVAFEQARSETRTKTSPLSGVWWEGSSRPEALVDGRLHGTPKPKNGQPLPRAVSSISHAAMNSRFDELMEALKSSGHVANDDAESGYREADRTLKSTAFRGWVGNRWTQRQATEKDMYT